MKTLTKQEDTQKFKTDSHTLRQQKLFVGGIFHCISQADTVTLRRCNSLVRSEVAGPRNLKGLMFKQT